MRSEARTSSAGHYGAGLHRPEGGVGRPSFVGQSPRSASAFMQNALGNHLGRKRISLGWINGSGPNNKIKKVVEPARSSASHLRRLPPLLLRLQPHIPDIQVLSFSSFWFRFFFFFSFFLPAGCILFLIFYCYCYGC